MNLLMRCILALVILVFITGCAIFPKKPSGEVVTFPDNNLETAIRNALEIPERPIYESDLEKLKELIATEKNIANLNGIKRCTNLKKLYLHVNQVSDITPLNNLISLEVLELGKNQISDITPLGSLTKLKRLYLYDNQISDISPLANLTDLRVLYLSNIGYRRLLPLQCCQRLETQVLNFLIHHHISLFQTTRYRT